MSKNQKIEKKYCIFCGEEIPKIAEYCEKCGKKLFIMNSHDTPKKKLRHHNKETIDSQKWRYFTIITFIALILCIMFFNYRLQQYIAVQNELNDEYQTLSSELERYKLRRPSLDELKEFLDKDYTDDRYWREEYDCKSFARDLKSNAKANGINMCIVLLDIQVYARDNYESFDFGTGHAINGVFLDDGTFVWIEPMDDTVFYSFSELEDGLLGSEALQSDDYGDYSVTINTIMIVEEVHLW